MLTAAWLVKGSAWGWGLLRSASPGWCLRATVAAAGARSRGGGGGGGGGGEPRDGPRAALAASSSSLAECRSPSSPGTGRRLLLRVRPASPKHLLGTAAWAPPFGCSSGGSGQPHCSRAGCGGAARRAAESSERPDAGKAEQRNGFAELYENPWTVPNLLSMARIGLAPILGYLIIEEDFNIALGVFALAGITDLLDGFIARNWANQKSALGSALDPLADKILISILYISLTCANLIPVPLTSMIILRDITLIAAVFYVRYRTLPPPKTLSRYFNPCYVTAQLKPTFISKVNTVVQLILVAASLAAPVFNYVDSVYLQTLWCITAFTTTASAYSYYHYGRKTVQVLNGK
ncbi:PREDICTED: cardiolipin synthase (CMP-forming) [Thamnophis sirtalis]|uniref:Cardiolipin synthase (CMP-forming) n=1 Tax=Thamnophis sirtalis TaxID=35019 RepID=A0A6I9YEN7_9SAUR|nr:PREDICTED: cardiolipin synthase (CMP-forming) [Thamnophis sirtalis]